jgi:hypothetical protein
MRGVNVSADGLAPAAVPLRKLREDDLLRGLVPAVDELARPPEVVRRDEVAHGRVDLQDR